MHITVIAHDLRSTHNVGSILRTADCLGVQDFYATGYTPYPHITGDTRLPHIASKLTAQIHKIALGAEQTVRVHHIPTLAEAVAKLKTNGFYIYALEQHKNSVLLDQLPAERPQKIALILGNEPNGLTPNELALADAVLEIRMFGHKESFNVSVAAGIALYELTKTS